MGCTVSEWHTTKRLLVRQQYRFRFGRAAGKRPTIIPRRAPAGARDRQTLTHQNEAGQYRFILAPECLRVTGSPARPRDNEGARGQKAPCAILSRYWP